MRQESKQNTASLVWKVGPLLKNAGEPQFLVLHKTRAKVLEAGTKQQRPFILIFNPGIAMSTNNKVPTEPLIAWHMTLQKKFISFTVQISSDFS